MYNLPVNLKCHIYRPNPKPVPVHYFVTSVESMIAMLRSPPRNDSLTLIQALKIPAVTND